MIATPEPGVSLLTCRKYAWMNVVVGAITYFYVLGFPAVLMPTLYPAIIEDTGWSRSAVMSLASFKFMSGAIFSMLVVFFIHRLGSKNMLLASAVINALAMGAFVFTHSLSLYYLLGVMLGVGAIAGTISIKILISQWFWHRQGWAVSLALLGAGFGAAVSPIAGQLMLEHMNWRDAILVLSLGIWFVVIPTIWLLAKPEPERFGYSSEEIDPGSYGGKFSPDNRLHKTIFKDAIKSKTFILLAIATLLVGFVDQGISQPTKTYLELDLGYSAMMAATAFSSIIVVSLFARVIFGWLFDRLSLLGVAICFFVGALSVLSILFISGAVTLAIFVLLRGLNHGGTLVDIPILAKHVFGDINLARMVGLLTGIYHLGMAMGPFFTGWVYDQTGSYFWGFLSCFVFAVMASAMVFHLALASRKVNATKTTN